MVDSQPYKSQSFWLGVTSALAVMFFLLFVGVLSGSINFGGTAVSPLSPKIANAAARAKINEKKVNKCLTENTYKNAIQESIKLGSAAGAKGTPYSVLTKDGKNVVINGALPKESIVQAIDDFDTTESAADITVEPVTEADHVRGSADATFTIIEYSDIDCPFCKRFHATMTELITERTDVRWVYRHFPLSALHPDATMKAEASECVAAIDGNEKFWSFLDALSSE